MEVWSIYSVVLISGVEQDFPFLSERLRGIKSIHAVVQGYSSGSDKERLIDFPKFTQVLHNKAWPGFSTSCANI